MRRILTFTGKIRNIRTILAASCLFAGFFAVPAAAIERVKVTVPVHEFKLDNGLKVLVKQDKRAPIAVVQLWYKVGSSYEHNGLTGLSHVVEHMMFKGTQKHPTGEFNRIIAENGAEDNAFTGQDYTAYYQIIAADRLEVAFELESDRVRNLTLPPAEFKKEVEVVKEERRWRTEDKPTALTREQFEAVAFLNSPYHNPVIGWMPDLDAMKVEDLRAWYERWYAPNNATLVVVGDVDPDKVHELAKKYYGPLKPTENIPLPKPQTEVDQKGLRTLKVKAPAELPYLMMGYKVPGMINAKEKWEPYALEMLASILDGGNSSRLSKELVRGKEIAAEASAWYSGFGRLPDLFSLSGTPAKGEKLETVKAALLEQVEKLKNEPVSADELARAKAQVIASEIYERDSQQQQATLLGSLETVGLGYKLADEYVDNILAITPEQIQSVAKKYLIEDTLTIAELDPQPIDPEQAEKRADFREIRTMLKKIVLAHLALLLVVLAPFVQAAPKIENWMTGNGLRVYYVHAPELPMVDLRLVFDAGSARDGSKPGLAMLTNNMLDRGAAGLNENQLAEQFESIGAVFSSGTTKDMGWTGLRTITLEKEQKAALDLWLKVLSKPDFPQKDFERVQKLMLVGLQAEKQDPESLGSKAFYKALYGDHPYGQPENGTEESIQALKVDDLKAFYQQHYVAKNGLLAIVGAVDRQQAEGLAEQVAGVLPAGEVAAPIPEVKPLTAAKTVKIPYPSAQSHILVGQIGNKRGDEDYFTLYMGNQVLGGSGFTSRLMKEVRNDRGLSYSVYSYFSPMAQLGVFEIGLQTKLEQTGDALKVVQDVLGKFQKDGPTAEELEASKKDISGGFPLRTANNSQIVEYVGVIGFYQLPLDYLDTFTGKVNALTREQIAEAFTRRVQPDKMVTVVVGGDEK